MSERTLTAKIVATDGASPVFKQVANGAQQMGTAVSTAGTHAAAGMKQAEDEGGRLRGVYENLRGAGASLGIALSAVGEIFGEMARASQEAGASEERLKTAVEDTGVEFSDYKDKIEAALQTGHDLAFSHEEVEGALSNLVTVTKDTSTALQDLSLAEDVARARGVSLSTAALAIGRAQEGNAAALTRLGFVVDSTATATEQLAAVQAQAAGQAQAFASTSAGSYDRVKDSIHNMLVEVGDHLGPMQTLLALLPGLSAGGTLVAGAFGELAEIFLRDEVAAQEMAASETEAAVATEALGVASAEAEVASGGLLAALGPIGLVAAAAAAAFGIYELVKGHNAESEAAKSADAATKALITTLHDLNAAGDPLSGVAQSENALVQSILAQLPADAGKLQAQIDALLKPFGGSNADVNILPPDVKAQFDDLFAHMTAAQGIIFDSTDVWSSFNNILRDTGTGADLAQKALDGAIATFGQTGDMEVFLATLIDIGTHLGDYDTQANQAADATKALSISQTGAADTFDALKQASDGATISFKNTAEGQKLLADIQEIATHGNQHQITALQAQTAALLAGTLGFDAYAKSVDYVAHSIEASTAATEAHARAIATEMDAQSSQQHQQETTAANMAGAASDADALAKANDALTQSWAQSAQGLQTLNDLQVIATQGTVEQRAMAQTFYQELQSGTITMAGYTASVHLEASAIEAQTAATQAAALAAQELFDPLGRLATVGGKVAAGVKSATGAVVDFGAALKSVAGAGPDVTGAIDKVTAAFFANNKEAFKNASDVGPALLAGVKAGTDAYLAEAKAVLDAANALGVMNSLAQQLQPINLKPFGADRATSATVDLQRTSSALDSVLNIYKEIDDLGQKSTQANSIAENLVGKPGEWATIDDMLKSGAISVTRYNEAVEAGYRIEERQKSVEEELNVIRAKQIPLLDQQDQAYQREIKAISHMSAQQQEVALGFLDTNEAAKAQQAVTLAASAAMGELGDHGEKAARKIIKGAIDADPVLKEMLKSIGLVTEDKDGTIHIHFDNATNLHKDLTAIKTDIDALIRVLGGIPPDVETKIREDGAKAVKKAAEDVQSGLGSIERFLNVDFSAQDADTVIQVANNVQGAVGSVERFVNVDFSTQGADTVIGVASAVQGALNSIDRFVNIAIQTTQTTVGGTSGNAQTGWSGGVVGDLPIKAYATGGVIARLGDSGPEMVTTPGGHQYMAWHDGIYNVPSTSYVNDAASTAQKLQGIGGGIAVTFTGPINGFAGMDDLMAAAARSARAHLAGLGL